MAFEIHVVVDAPAVCDAVNNLAAALRTKSEVPKVDPESALPVQTETPTKQTANIQPTPVVQPPVQHPAPVPAPVAQPVMQPPVSQPQPSVQPAPVPVEHQYTVDEISRAGAALLEQPGKMGQLVALLGKYGVPSVVGLNPNQYAAFAADLKALGADL